VTTRYGSVWVGGVRKEPILGVRLHAVAQQGRFDGQEQIGGVPSAQGDADQGEHVAVVHGIRAHAEYTTPQPRRTAVAEDVPVAGTSPAELPVGRQPQDGDRAQQERAEPAQATWQRPAKPIPRTGERRQERRPKRQDERKVNVPTASTKPAGEIAAALLEDDAGSVGERRDGKRQAGQNQASHLVTF